MATIILTGGGTAGHCVPNLALIPHLKKYFDKIYYIGSQNKIESRLVKNANIPYFSIDCAGFSRSLSLKNLAIPFKVFSGYKKAKEIIERLKPDVIFSKGGYVSLPVVLAGRNKKIPVLCHESDLSLGLANKFSSKYCDKVLTSFPETAKDVKNGLFVGSPLREQLFTAVNKKDVLNRFGFSGKKPIVLITGGSQGAKAINDCVKRSIDTLLVNYDVIHLCGKNNKSNVSKSGYFVAEYLDHIEDAFKICSVCVSRAGANTLFELLSLKIPTVLIPLPKGNSRGDQVKNAEYFSKKGLVYLLSQQTLSPKSLEFAVNATYANRLNIKRELEKTDYSQGCQKIAQVLKGYIS